MEAAVNDTPFEQQFPIDAEKPSFKKEISAKKLWDKIVHNAWKSAEPGVLFGIQLLERVFQIAMPT